MELTCKVEIIFKIVKINLLGLRLVVIFFLTNNLGGKQDFQCMSG